MYRFWKWAKNIFNIKTTTSSVSFMATFKNLWCISIELNYSVHVVCHVEQKPVKARVNLMTHFTHKEKAPKILILFLKQESVQYRRSVGFQSLGKCYLNWTIFYSSNYTLRKLSRIITFYRVGPSTHFHEELKKSLARGCDTRFSQVGTAKF